MRLIAYDGKPFADLNVDGGYPDEIGQSGPGVSPITIEREGLPPLYVGMRRQPRIFTAEFTVVDGAEVEPTITGLLGALRCGDSKERVLAAAFNDDTEVECLMAAGQWRKGDVNSIFVDFHAADDRWQKRVATDLPEVIVGNGVVVPLNNAGGADVQPELVFGWSDLPSMTDAFPANVSDWLEEFNHASATVAWTWDNTTYHTAVGSALATIPANTVVGAVISNFVNQDRMAVSVGQTVSVNAWVRTDHVDLRPILTVAFYDSAGVYLSTSEQTQESLAIDTWHERWFTATAPASAAFATVAFAVWSVSSGAFGHVRFDDMVAQVHRTTSATVGWKYITQETITNSGTRPWRRVRMTVDLGDHAALVTAGKSLASGNDLRVRVHGTPSWMEIPRTLTNVNTKRTLCHFYVTIPAGQSVTYDFCYGNASATTPETLSVRTVNAERYAADDLEGTSGTATAGGASTLTDSGKSWESNRWRYGYIQIVGGTGSGQRRQILSNTATQITVTRAWVTNPTSSSVYVIWITGIAVDGGAASAAGTTTSLTDSSQTWSTNQWKGATLTNVTKGVSATVISNTATVLTTSSMTAPASSDVYRLERYGVFTYMVNRSVTETAHRGLWRLNKYFNKGGRVWYGDQTPGGWVPWLMLPNQDDKALGRYVDEGPAGGHAISNMPYLYARRSVRSDNTWPEKSQADGAVLYDPRAFIALDWDYQMKNEGGIGQVVILTQEPDGDDWQTVATDSTLRSSLVNVTGGSGISGYQNLTGDQTPVRIYIGVLPQNGVEIPSTAKKDRSIELRNNVKMVVHLDITDCGGLSSGIYSVGSETEVYDLQAEYRIGGGEDADPPYERVAANVLLPADRDLRINPNLNSGLPLVGIYNALTGALVERAPLAATIYHHELNLDGVDTGTETKTLMPLRPGRNALTYPDSITDWTISAAPGVTATLHNETSVTYDGNGQAIRVHIASAPVGFWSLQVQPNQDIAVVPGAQYDFGAVVRASITGLTATVDVEWQENQPGGPSSVTDGVSFQTVPLTVADRWYPIGSGKTIFAGSTTDPPTGGADFFFLIEGTGNVSGDVYIDAATLGPPNLYVTEEEPGELTFSASWREAFYG